MDKPKPNRDFKLISFAFKFRDFFVPRMNILKEVGIKPGFHVLDYGCGPGGYIVPLAELVGKSGKIYALDILSFSDHHMKENEIVSKVTNRGLFRLLRKGERTYTFLKEE